MTDSKAGTSAGKKSRIGILVALVVVVAAIAGVLAFGGWDYISSLFGGKDAVATVKPVDTTPSKPADNTDTTTTEPAKTPSVDPDAQARMYAQQLQSQAIIADLAAGKVSKINISAPKVASTGATTTIQAVYADGTTVSGTMSFVKYDEGWYFASIARDGSQVVSAVPAVDTAVVKTITDQQAEYQAVIAGLLDGGYKTITLSAPSAGEGTVTIPVTVGGGKLADHTGSVVLISKVINGSQTWFLTSLR